jgi:hypothetical protein
VDNNIYKKLLKIKKPVLIELHFMYRAQDRFRILYPDGKCEYSKHKESVDFIRSCFSSNNLKTTIKEMKEYDRGLLKIVKYEEI